MNDAWGSNAVAALRREGLLEDGDSASFEQLDGGVSNDVVLIRSAGRAYVAKRALARLRVTDRWDASVARSVTEAAALRWAKTINPDAIPEVVATDNENNILVEALAPVGFDNWKVRLLDGHVDNTVGRRLGTLLGRWHVASSHDPDVLNLFASRETFRQLRVEPFYQAAAQRHPAVEKSLTDLAERMAACRQVLVHGDFSPKNILVENVHNGGIWVIDWEVAHAGDPVFDLAFLLHHLICKAIARPQFRAALSRTAGEFLAAYAEATHDDLPPIDSDYLGAHTAALLLARVDGKSPVDYFNDDHKAVARTISLAGLAGQTMDITDLWRALGEL